jgi:hypothetical protein
MVVRLIARDLEHDRDEWIEHRHAVGAEVGAGLEDQAVDAGESCVRHQRLQSSRRVRAAAPHTLPSVDGRLPFQGDADVGGRPSAGGVEHVSRSCVDPTLFKEDGRKEDLSSGIRSSLLLSPVDLLPAAV